MNKLYSLCDEFFALQPWEFLFENDLFGIKSPDSEITYFISIMGRNKEVYALSAYLGEEALYNFWNISESKGKIPPENILLIPHLMLSFGKWDDLSKQQQQTFKKYSLKCANKGLYPNIEQIIPGYLPGIPDNNALQEMIYILSQSIDVIKRAVKNKGLIHSYDHFEDEYLIRESTKVKDQIKWQDVYRRVPLPKMKKEISCQNHNLESFNKIPVSRKIIEMDMVMLLSPVEEKGVPPFFPFILVFYDPKNDIILNFELLKPYPDYNTMIRNLPDNIFKKLIDIGIRPSKLKYRSLQLELPMRFIEGKSVQKTEQSYHLDKLNKAVQSLIDHFSM